MNFETWWKYTTEDIVDSVMDKSVGTKEVARWNLRDRSSVYSCLYGIRRI